MGKRIATVAILAAAHLIATSCTQTPSAAPEAASSYVSPETPQGSGPFKAIMETDAGLPTHTIYRPDDMAALEGEKLPIIAWGNGACMNVGNRFRYFLTEIASHGYLAIAIGPIGPPEMELTPQENTSPAEPAGEDSQPAPTRREPETHASQLIDAVDWAIAENSREGSRYFSMLDTSKIIIMGQSCGGVQAIQASSDPRVVATVAWSSGLLPNPSPAMDNISKEALKELHAPIAYFNGDEENDIASRNAADDFERINHVPVFRAYRIGMPHVGTYREPNGGELGKIAVAYLQWRIRDDPSAAKMFEGADCTLCVDPNWRVFKKEID